MAPGKKPLGGELGGFAIADFLNAIAEELDLPAEFAARVLARLEGRGGKSISSKARADRAASPREEPILIETQPGDDFTLAIKWGDGKIRVFRRVSFLVKLIKGKRRKFGNWQGACVKCGAPFLVETFAGIKTAKSLRFSVTTCPDHRKRNGEKPLIAPVLACEETSD